MSQALVPRTDETFRLPDGRTLAYAEWGDPEGTPVLLFHGLPSSRLIFPDPDAAAEMRVRAITIDRPGIGGSDPQPGHWLAMTTRSRTSRTSRPRRRCWTGPRM